MDFVALLSIRLYLLPTLYEGAHAKVTGFSGLVEWFATPAAQGGLGMPLPTLMATLATGTEVAGLICIALGLFTRIVTIPLAILMTVAGLAVQSFPGRFNYVTELGDPIILNNGIEFTVTYAIMIMVLFFYGAGRYVSADHWLAKVFPRWPK
ncbi:hypothetical protein D3C75_1049960 [compost metagenome]